MVVDAITVERVQNMNRAVRNVRRAEDGEEAAQCEEVVLKKRQRLERGEIPMARWVVLVGGRVSGSYRERRDGVVSGKLVWSDAG